MTLIDQTHLPYYKRYTAFEKYVPFISKYLNEGGYAHSPLGSIETFVSRFNFAVKSALQYNYEHLSISTDDFRQKAPTLTSVMRPGYVLIGTLAFIKQWDKEHPGDKLSPTPETINQLNPAKAVETLFKIKTDLSNRRLEMICELIGSKAFSPMPAFIVELPDERLREALTEKFDLEFDETNEKHVYRIL